VTNQPVSLPVVFLGATVAWVLFYVVFVLGRAVLPIFREVIAAFGAV
jgi:hypothetical protein